MTVEKMMTFADAIRKHLPHGSGFNGDWHITVKGDRVKCSNVYDNMSESGMYDAYLPFTVSFTENDISIHFNHCNSRDYYVIRMNGLREYFYDVFGDVLNEALREN